MYKILAVILLLIICCIDRTYCLSADVSIEKAEGYGPIEVLKEKRIDLSDEKWHEGLFIEDNGIWVNNGKGFNIDVMDIAKGEKVAEIISPVSFMEGLDKLSKNRYVWTDWDSRALFFGKLQNEELIPEKTIDLGELYPAGITVVKDQIFVVIWKRGILGTKYYLLCFDDLGQLIKVIRIKHIKEPSQLAWDGSFIWISSWYSEKVYKLDINGYKLKGFFKTGIERTTGIVWDKDRFWVTGTSEDLYTFKIS